MLKTLAVGLALLCLSSPAPFNKQVDQAAVQNETEAISEPQPTERSPEQEIEMVKPLPPLEVKEVETIAEVKETPVPAAPQVQAGCGDNEFAQFIYQHESGCNLQARNAGGCLGIGQACPGSKLLAVCPNLDYACQNAFFTQYAVSRYGSWAGAYAAWTSQNWW